MMSSPILATLTLSTLLGGILAVWLLSAGAVAWRRNVGIAVSSISGALVSLYLGLQHQPTAGRSFCAVSQTFDCDTVNRSAWSEVAGIPIAWFGFAFYIAILAAALLRISRPERAPRAGSLVFAGGVLAVLYSAFLAAVSAQLGKWCLLCVSMYGLNLIILVGGLLEARATSDETSLLGGVVTALRGEGDKTLWTMVVAGMLALITSVGLYNSHTASATPSAANLGSLYAELAVGPELDGTEPILGSKQAPYTVVEFADFQCPACAGEVAELFDMVKQHPEVRLLFKHYPISNICNPAIQGERHPRSCVAAAAAECARQQGHFFDLEKLLFANQQYLEDSDIRFMVSQVGLDKDAFESCWKDERTMAAVTADAVAGDAAGLEYTPSFFLQGIRDDGAWVQVLGGAAEITRLVQAHMAGTL